MYHCMRVSVGQVSWVSLKAYNWFYTLIQQHSNRFPRPSEWEMLFGYRRVVAGFMALLGITRHQIWCTRNRHRFEGIPPSSTATLAKVKSSFRFLARVQQRHVV